MFTALGALGASDANADALDVNIRAISAAQWYGDDRGDLLTLKLEVTNNADFPVKLALDGQSFAFLVFVFAPTTPDSALPGMNFDVLRDAYSVRVYYDMVVWNAGPRASVCPADQTVNPGTTSTVKMCFYVPPGETPDFVQMGTRPSPESNTLFATWQFVDVRSAHTCEEAWGKGRSSHCAPGALFDGYPDRKPIEYLNTEPLAVEIGVKSSRLLKSDGASGVVLAMEVSVTNTGNEEVSGSDMRVAALRGGEAVFYEYWTPGSGDLYETCPYSWKNTDIPPGLDETWRVCFRIPDTVEPEFLIIDDFGRARVIPLAAGADCEVSFSERLCGEAAPVFGVPGAPKVESPETTAGDGQSACRDGAYECLDAAVDLVKYERRPLCEDCDSDTVSVSVDAKYMDHTAGAAFRGAHDLVVFSVKIDPKDRLVMEDLRFVLRFEHDGVERTYFPANDHAAYGVEPSIRDTGLRNEIGIECTGLGDYAVEPLQTVRLCFPVPAGVRELGALGMFNTEPSPDQYLEVSLGGVCGPNCVGEWDIPAPQIPDGYAPEARPAPTTSYAYVVTNADFYDRKFPSYSGTIERGVAAGLDDWSRINPIGFERVDDPSAADLTITMGGTGENPGFVFGTDTYGRVSDVGCLRDRADDCSITLFVEDEYRGSVDLFTEEMIRFVTAHEVGHTLGFKHHGSATHVMYSPLDGAKSWYDDGEYGLNAPDISRPQYSTISAERDTHIIELPSRAEVYTNPAFGYGGGSTDLPEELGGLSLDDLRDRWDMLVEGGERVSDELADIVEELFARAGATP